MPALRWQHQSSSDLVLAAATQYWPSAGILGRVLAERWHHQSGTGLVLAASTYYRPSTGRMLLGDVS